MGALDEVVGGDFDAFALEETEEMVVEHLDVECLERLEIVFAVRLKWSAVAVDEIVVERHLLDVEA